MSAPEARKPSASISPNDCSVSGPMWISGSTRSERSCPRRGSEVVQRVDRDAVDARLEVQVVPEAVAGAPDVADDLALGDARAHGGREARLVRVAGGEPAARVLDARVVAVAVDPAQDHDAPGRGGAD